ncbi:MAG: acyl-CoA dehydrogenase family protein [Thermoanaerobaculia bacterium]
MPAGLDRETLDLTLDSLREFAQAHLPDDKLLDLDAKDEFPLATVRDMCGGGLGVQLLFIPEEYGGMGGGAFDVYRVCEALARVDLGVATGVLATFLGSDPIVFGGTPEQKRRWLSRIAEEGLLMAYAATEPEAGSDLAALRTTAKPVEGGYVLDGNKQWISNGGFADLYCVLALAPGGPSWFVVERGTPGLSWGKPEDKHGIRASNTAEVSLAGVRVETGALVGGVEGQGLLQAQAVFGYTRLMVAAFGLGAGWAALDRAIPYSQERIQAGGPLSEKQGYTHKLIVPHAARLEASRAYIEETAERIDAGIGGQSGSLNTEGAIAKYLASEFGNLAADAAIQALGGYGYTREYMVEKIKRDVRITTIYEGTSEILEMTISRDRWQLHLKSRGEHYHSEARVLEALHAKHPDVGAETSALALHALAEILERARAGRLTRNQHILFRLGELIAWAECAASFCRRAARFAEGRLNDKADRRFSAEALATLSRIFAREAASKVSTEGLRWMDTDLIQDMDRAADALYHRAPVTIQGALV